MRGLCLFGARASSIGLGLWLVASTLLPLAGVHAQLSASEREYLAEESRELTQPASPEEHHEPEWNYVMLAGQFLNFAIWIGLLYLLISKVLPKFLADRRAGIVEGLEEASRMKEEAEAKLVEYTKRIETMDEELARVRDDMRKAGEGERDRLVREAEERVRRMHEDARFLVDQRVKELREQLTREAIEAAIAAADAVLKERTTAADQARLAEEYLARLAKSEHFSQPGAES